VALISSFIKFVWGFNCEATERSIPTFDVNTPIYVAISVAAIAATPAIPAAAAAADAVFLSGCRSGRVSIIVSVIEFWWRFGIY